jgi:hypothetical protein
MHYNKYILRLSDLENFSLKMSENKLTLQRQTILYFWNQGIHSPKELQKITSIPLTTIKYNI